MSSQVVDGVLNFFVNYNCFTYKQEDGTAMGEMESNITVKEGD
jgi:hypothetical protein